MKFKRLAILLLIAAVLWTVYYIAAGRIETARSNTPLPTGMAGAGPVVPVAALMKDVRTLAAADNAGRGTGSAGSKLAQAYLMQRFQELGLKPFGTSYLTPFSFTHTRFENLFSAGKPYKVTYPSAANVIGFIPGSMDPNRFMVVSAHYDHLGVREGVMYPGADDNASGVAAMLALAAYFKQHPPQHTVVFAAFDAEELGHHGARHFVNALPFPRGQLAFNLNLDMVSRNDSNEIWASGLHHYPALKPHVAGAASRSTVQVKLGHDKPMLLAGNVEDWTGMSDHDQFHKAGVPYLYFGVADHADYHGPGDTADKINPVFFSNVVSLLIDVAATADKHLQSIR